MRADLLMEICPHMTARDAVLLVLQSDREAVYNITGGGWGAVPRTIKQLQVFNPKVRREVLWRLHREGWVEPVGTGWRLKVLLGVTPH